MTRQVPRISFQPSLVIFADEVGNRIYEHLLSTGLLSCLSEEQLRCIGFIQVTPKKHCVSYWLASEKKTNIKESGLEEAIWDMLPRVSKEKSIRMLRSAGYEMLDDLPQIYIVGHAHVAEMDAILHLIENLLRELSKKAHINFLLGCSPPSREVARQWQQDGHILFEAVEQLAQRTGIAFCYVYGNLLGVGYTEEEIYYAASEALFILLATSIIQQKELQQIVQDSLSSSMYVYATVNTCLIRFPDEIAREYCRAQMGLAVVDQWLKEISRNPVSKSTQEALDTLRKIESLLCASMPLAETHLDGSQPWWARWIQKDMSLISSGTTTPNLWPYVENSLDAIVEHQGSADQQTVYRQLHKETQLLFEMISFKSIQRSHRFFQKWLHAATIQYNRARAKQTDWKNAADSAWEDVTAKAYALIETTVKKLWNDGAGLAVTVAYIDALDNELKQLKKRIRSEVKSNAVSTHMSQEGDVVVKEEFQKLEARIIYEQEQLPVVTELFWLGIVAAGPTLPIVVLILQPFLHQLFALVFVTGLIVSGFVLLVWLLSLRQHHLRIVPVKVDVIQFYRRQHIEHCKKYEAEKRLASVRMLRQHIACLKSTFLKTVRKDFFTNTCKAIDSLFANIAASRDLFMGNAEYFSQNTFEANKALQHIAKDILRNIAYLDQLQGNKQEVLWSREDLLKTFQARLLSCAEMKKMVIESMNRLSRSPVDKFLQEKVSGMRSTGAIVNKQLWEDVFERLNAPISNAQSNAQEQRRYYLCGARKTVEWAQKQVETIRQEIIPTPSFIPSPVSQMEDWLLVATLSCHQAPIRPDDSPNAITSNVVDVQPDPNG